jgi:glycosyltransferase involved in cell wall biosynthesis
MLYMTEPQIQTADILTETPQNLHDASGRGFPPVRVVYMVDSLREPQGGGEQALLRTIRHLPRDRFQPSVVTFSLIPRVREILRELECPLYLFPMQRTYDWTGLNAALRISRLFRTIKPDIVHTLFESSNTWGGLVTKLSVGALLVSSRRDMGILRSTKHKIAYTLVDKLADGVHVVSEELRRRCIDIEHVRPEKVFTVHNGVDLSLIDSAVGGYQLKRSLGLNRASHVVATVANIRKVKGIDTLLETADIVRRKFSSVMFAIVGSSNEPRHFRELQRFIKDRGLESNVRFLGPLEDVFPFLKLADVFCLLSRSEGFSNALLEAMACRLPCVVTRLGGNAEAIADGENGFLVPTDDPSAAAARITNLLQEREYAWEVGQKARRTVESRFGVEMMVDQLTFVYDSLLKSGRTRNAAGTRLSDPLFKARHNARPALPFSEK